MTFINNNEIKLFRIRLLKAITILIVMSTLLVLNLFRLQIYNYNLYSNLAKKNQLENIPIESHRGLIYDRKGRLLVDNVPIFNLNVFHKNTKNVYTIINELKTIISISSKDIDQFNKILKKNKRYESIPIKLNLNKEELAIFYMNQYRFPEVKIDIKMNRRYLYGGVTVTPIGYVGKITKQELLTIDKNNYTNDSFIGKVGIEKFYEKILRGKIGYKIIEIDANGNIIRTVKIIPPISGFNIYLTIDYDLQKIAQEAISKEKGSIVAIDPSNGEILALVSSPTYDPNLFINGIDSNIIKLRNSSAKPMYNRATRGIFPFGSTIKPFIALQALDTKIIKQDFEIIDPGWFKLENNKQVIRDWQYNGHGIVNFRKAITESCSTFFYDISIKLGIESISKILFQFGFGSKTNIDIIEESSGIVATPQWKINNIKKNWYIGDTLNSGIGQGYMKTTAIQLANGVATIAMHGKRYRPHLLLATQNAEKIFNKQKNIQLNQIILNNSNNWNLIIEAMKDVIMKKTGTAYTRFGSGFNYTIAGKTGTAQLYHHKIVNENPNNENEKNIPKHLRNHNLFIAFAPIEKPKIALAVIVENNNCAPQIARKIFDYYLSN